MSENEVWQCGLSAFGQKLIYSLNLAIIKKVSVHCTNVVHDLSSAEPRFTLHQVELGSADPVQLNGRGYTVDDSSVNHAWPTGQLR